MYSTVTQWTCTCSFTRETSSHIKHTLNNASVCKIHTWPFTKCPFARVHPYSPSFLSKAAAAVGLWSSEARMVGAVAVLGTDTQHGFIHLNVAPLYIFGRVVEKGWDFICQWWHLCLTECFQSSGLIMSAAWLKAFYRIWWRATSCNDQVTLELNSKNLGLYIN